MNLKEKLEGILESVLVLTFLLIPILLLGGLIGFVIFDITHVEPERISCGGRHINDCASDYLTDYNFYVTMENNFEKTRLEKQELEK